MLLHSYFFFRKRSQIFRHERIHRCHQESHLNLFDQTASVQFEFKRLRILALVLFSCQNKFELHAKVWFGNVQSVHFGWWCSNTNEENEWSYFNNRFFMQNWNRIHKQKCIDENCRKSMEYSPKFSSHFLYKQ